MTSLTLIIIATIITPNLSWGQFCSQGNEQAQQWREQSLWVEKTINPSSANPHFQFKTFSDSNNQVRIEPFDIKGHYQSKLSIDIKSVYTEKKFIDFCANDKKYGSSLTAARIDESNLNEFRIPLTYLPSFPLGKQNPYSLQGFVLDANGIGVKVVLNENSVVKTNSSWADLSNDIELQLSQTITQNVKKQLASGMTGSVTLVLDGMDDLACDILKGNAELRFFHSGKMISPKIEMKNETQVDDLFDLYSLLKESDPLITNREKRFFDAGVLWFKREQSTIGSTINNSDKAFKILNQLLDHDTAMTKKNISDEEMICLAENESDFLKRSYNASVSVIVKTQTLTQQMAEL